MTLTNEDIAKILRQYADMLEIYADNPYRIRAYKKAARSIATYQTPLSILLAEEEDLTQISNVGKGIAAQIKIIFQTGSLPDLKTATERKNFKSELLHVHGLGKKRVALIQSELEITSKKELIAAIQDGTLALLKGFNSKLTSQILHDIQHPKPYENFFRYKLVESMVNYVIKLLMKNSEIVKVIPTGNYRRKAELVGNIVILAISPLPQKVIKQFISLPIIEEVVKKTKSVVIVKLRSKLQITIKFVDTEKLAIALLFATGSETHLNALKKYAHQKNFKLSTQGLYKNDSLIETIDEKQIYRRLNLQFIEPELRENRGEIEASANHSLPCLIQQKDIRGDLHSHTNETDGVNTLEEMANAAMQLGYEYLAITDHSKRLKITNGLDEKRLLQQIKLIDKLNSKFKNFTILKASEIDILEDGRLDFSDDILKELDIRVCSIHSLFKLPEEKQTERIIRAMDNPYFNILGHATGRLLTSRSPYPIHIEKIIKAAKDRGCFLELNAQPARLDINDSYCLQAKKHGVKIAISSDAHSIFELENMQYGIYQARRGWLERHDVINTLSLNSLKKLLKRA